VKNNNVYIPENIVKGWVVQCPRDNNYVLAAMFDFMKKTPSVAHRGWYGREIQPHTDVTAI